MLSQLAFVTDVFIPLSLVLVMFGLGTGLTRQDFTRLVRAPTSVLAGLAGQILLLPLLALVTCELFALPPHYAIGFMIIGACPGGTISNVFSQLSRANVALSVTLTAMSSMLCVVTTPLIIQLALVHYAEGNYQDFSLLGTSLGLLIMSIVPVCLGMAFNRYFPDLAKRMQPLFKKMSVLVMLTIVIGVVAQQQQALRSDFTSLFFAALTMHGLSTLAGLLIARWARLDRRDATTLGIEVGVQNGSLALVITMTMMSAPELAIACTVYGLVMFIGGSLLSLLNLRQFA